MLLWLSASLIVECVLGMTHVDPAQGQAATAAPAAAHCFIEDPMMSLAVGESVILKRFRFQCQTGPDGRGKMIPVSCWRPGKRRSEEKKKIMKEFFKMMMMAKGGSSGRGGRRGGRGDKSGGRMGNYGNKRGDRRGGRMGKYGNGRDDYKKKMSYNDKMPYNKDKMSYYNKMKGMTKGRRGGMDYKKKRDHKKKRGRKPRPHWGEEYSAVFKPPAQEPTGGFDLKDFRCVRDHKTNETSIYLRVKKAHGLRFGKHEMSHGYGHHGRGGSMRGYQPMPKPMPYRAQPAPMPGYGPSGGYSQPAYQQPMPSSYGK